MGQKHTLEKLVGYCVGAVWKTFYSIAGADGETFTLFTFSMTPSVSRSSAISVAPANGRLTPRGRPRHEDRLIELRAGHRLRIPLTASSETDDPQRFK